MGLGALGVVVPGLPTTPFILLASWLFYRSSPRLQKWLLESWLGGFVRRYHRRGGMTVLQKVTASGIMATAILLSVFVFIPSGSVARYIVSGVGIVGLLVMVFMVPNAHGNEE